MLETPMENHTDCFILCLSVKRKEKDPIMKMWAIPKTINTSKGIKQIVQCTYKTVLKKVENFLLFDYIKIIFSKNTDFIKMWQSKYSNYLFSAALIF